MVRIDEENISVSGRSSSTSSSPCQKISRRPSVTATSCHSDSPQDWVDVTRSQVKAITEASSTTPDSASSAASASRMYARTASSSLG